MAERTQINFRLDNNLLAAIRATCEALGITQTEFLTNAIIAALGNDTSNHTSTPAIKALEKLASRLAEMEKTLAERLETEQRLSERIAALENQQMGELAA